MDQIHHLILPAFAVGLGWVGYLARLVRASMLEVMGENYIRAARSFGLSQRTVIYRYALKVAILPTITLIGIGFGNLLAGAVYAEIIFARPGIGKLIYDMVMSRNFPVIQGAVLITTALYVLITLFADLMVAWMDPRVRESLL
jgi:peptide/nickel transport system permease protein